MGWDSNQPTTDLSDCVKEKFSDEATTLLNDLVERKHKVVLIETDEGRRRYIETRNPNWYRRLYWSNKHFRRDRTKKALERIIHSTDKRYGISPSKHAPHKYSAIYRQLIFSRLTEGYESEEWGPAEPHKEVMEFFEVKPFSYYTEEELARYQEAETAIY